MVILQEQIINRLHLILNAFADQKRREICIDPTETSQINMFCFFSFVWSPHEQVHFELVPTCQTSRYMH